ncbi:MAG: glycosyltransferase [Lactovum sp.]
MTRTLLIMATYNGCQYLKQQLDSIRKQEYPVDRLIFRDDASTDETVSLLKTYISEYNLSHWEVRENEKNIGWRHNFHQLLIDAQDYCPEFIFFSDQDDIWDLDKNKKQLEIIENHPEIDLLTADMKVLKINKKVSENHYHEFLDKENNLSKFPERLIYKSFRPGWTLVVRNQLVKDTLSFWPKEIEINHDALLEDLSSLLGRGYNLNRSVGQHLRHGKNASGKAIISLSSTRQEHIKALYDYQGFFEIIYQVLKKRHRVQAQEVKEIADFYQRRYELAQVGEKNKILKGIIKDWSYYESFSGRIRDFLFTFKK